MMKSLKQVFEEQFQEQGITNTQVFDYADPGDFNALWSMPDLPRQILLLWSRTPSDPTISPIDATPHLTPLHWATCLSKAAEGEKPPKCPPHRITILDLCPWTNQAGLLYELFRDLDPDRIPWIRVLQPSDFVGKSTSLKELLFPNYTETQEGLLNNWPSRTKVLIRTARDELSSPSDPENRHAIANLIGPMILTGKSDSDQENLPNDKGPDHRNALKTLLHCTGFFAEDSGNPEEREPLSIPADLELVLFDDQARHGWDAWLKDESRELLEGAPGFVSVDEVRSIEEWIDDLVTVLKARSPDAPDAWVHDLRFRLSYPKKPAATLEQPNPQILFLDLRLFAGRPVTEECRFYLKVAELWEALAARRELVNKEIKSELEERLFAWSEDLGATVLRIKEACTNRDPKLAPETHLDALTLFPRVLAQLDLSFPIVIFSSTTQAAALKKFAPYGNIITAFAKPAFFATGPDGVREQSREGLHQALQKAIMLLRVRDKCQAIRKLNQDDHDPNLDFFDEAGPDVHVELYVDETGEPDQKTFLLGGLIAVFSDKDNARKAADTFEDLCVEHGLRYFDFPYLDPKGPSIPLEKKKDTGRGPLADSLHAAAEADPHTRPMLGLLRIKPTLDPYRELKDSDLLDPDSHDNKFRFSLACMIELFIAESIPQIQREKRPKALSTAIYVGTRLGRLAEGDLDYSYGIPIRYKRLRAISECDIFPIVAEAIRHHPTSIQVERTIGVSLPYAGETKSDVGYVLDRSKKEVHEFKYNRDLSYFHPDGSWYGRIVSKTATAGWIKVHGFGENLRCHRDFWHNFDAAREREYVKIKDIAYDKAGKLQCGVIGFASEKEFSEWESDLSKGISDEFLPGCKLADLRPDYRALHYIADQVTSKRKGKEGFDHLLEEPLNIGQFSDVYQNPLAKGLKASRAMDQAEYGLSVAEFDVVSPASFYPDSISARTLIGRRLSRRLPNLSGIQLYGAALRIEIESNAERTKPDVGSEVIDPAETPPDLIFEVKANIEEANILGALLGAGLKKSDISRINESSDPMLGRRFLVYLSGVDLNRVNTLKKGLKYWRVK